MTQETAAHPAEGDSTPAAINYPTDTDNIGTADIKDTDRDALHILPLATVPLQSSGLKTARMIKNAHLESVVEVFQGKQSGSGQIALADLTREFGLTSTMVGKVPQPHPDLAVMRRLARLPSFDVYSLRIALRKVGIDVNSVDALKLSGAKQAELTTHMTEFTRPLIAVIYGPEDQDIRNFNDIIALFKNPDVKTARKKLQLLANTLDIKPMEVPQFLEDFGDIFLSMSYYKQCLGDIEDVVYEILDCLLQIRKSRQFKDNTELLKNCFVLESVITALMAAITGRFEHFEHTSKTMWTDLSAQSFHQVKNMVRSYHTVIGGALCALTVKMAAWRALFPNKHSGGLTRRAEFVMNDLIRGIESIREIEDAVINKTLDNHGTGRPRPTLLQA